MRILLTGEVRFIGNNNNWVVEVFAKWNRRRIDITLKSRNLNLKTDFVSCALTEAKFLTLITRSDSYNFSGRKSEFSELILESAAAQSLMSCRNASIKLHEKHLIFHGGIRKSDETSLSNIFKLNEILMADIDILNH